ncbi:PfkB family carbohydrate kinase [Spirillospora albida]|uniref:PfkB family carbohydrate kinase n=1 Tax=Spirillospora albida TaxID=58123 RepID=UPI0004C1DD2B|nr:PfkB family carbohydrate kinase [Spirillospora albida]
MDAPGSSPVRWPSLDGAERRRFSLFVIGDVRVEVRAVLPDVAFRDLTSDRLSYAPARAVVAGTAVNFARVAVRRFRRVTVLAKVGDDDFTPVIRKELRRIGVRDRVRAERGARNGVTVMLRDRPDGPGPGVRLLVAEEDAPGRRLTAAEVGAAAAGIRRADVLVLDGYALLSPVSRAAVRAAAEIARAAGTRVAFDLVPHDIDARLPSAEVLPFLGLADVVFAEAHTLARVLRRPVPVGTSEIRALTRALDAAIEGSPLCFLRHGETSLECTLVHRRGREPEEYATGYREGVERTGFGDRLAAAELYRWLAAG